MSKELTIHKDGNAIYPIYIENDYSGLGKVLNELELFNRKVLIVTDTNVGVHHAKEVEDIAREFVSVVETITIPAGEAYKNLDSVHQIYQKLIEDKFDRNDVLIALGGGVIGDMTGFTAATYLRGIRFIQLPTSLLAMVDSSIGGKTGVDFQAYKNMVGAFYQPKAVYMNLHTLHTLPEREFYSGFGEIIKHGLIKDSGYYNWLLEHDDKILAKTPEFLEETIYRSLLVKQAVVENDPYEKGERALLNFGHTLGHAVEKLMNFSLLHGECVSLGIVTACFLSMQFGHITKKEYDSVCDILKAFHLPVSLPSDALNIEEVVHATKNDKKMDSGKIKFILLETLGNAYINKELTDAQLTLAVREILDV